MNAVKEDGEAFRACQGLQPDFVHNGKAVTQNELNLEVILHLLEAGRGQPKESRADAIEAAFVTWTREVAELFTEQVHASRERVLFDTIPL